MINLNVYLYKPYTPQNNGEPDNHDVVKNNFTA